jgi:hypothetical protein
MDTAFRLSNEILNVPDSDRAYTLEDWHDRLKDNGRIYLAPQDDPKSFLITFGAQDRTTNKEPSTHIWLCGTLPDARGTGLFSSLIRTMLRDSMEPWITVSTYPAKWTDMYSWIQRAGFTTVSIFPDGKCAFEIPTETLKTHVEKN